MKPEKTSYLCIKRLFDIICSFIGCIILIPIIIIVKIVTVATGDFATIFYVQKRIGLHGKEFNMYKFRTMHINAGEMLKELLKDKKLKKEWEENHKLNNDPRITKLGKILRKTSIDEFPQMINVLIGNMSMIGPRPLVPGELDMHNGNHKIYESVRPGISGYWATHGRSAINFKERLKLEYYYCNNASLWLDIKIIIKTIYVVLKGDGAK